MPRHGLAGAYSEYRPADWRDRTARWRMKLEVDRGPLAWNVR